MGNQTKVDTPEIKPMTMDHYASVLRLWESGPGVVFRAPEAN
jgi:hypothetical protein